MTQREKDIYDFIVNYLAQNGRAPTFLEIGAGVGLRSSSTVHKHVTALVEKGYLQHSQGAMRALIPVNVKDTFSHAV